MVLERVDVVELDDTGCDLLDKKVDSPSGGVNFCNQYEFVLITPYFFVINWPFCCSQYVKYRNQYEEKGNQYEKRGNQYEKKR